MFSHPYCQNTENAADYTRRHFIFNNVQSLEKGVDRSVKEVDSSSKPRSENGVPQAKRPIPKNLRVADRGKMPSKKYTVLNNNGVLPKSELRKSKPRSLQKTVSDKSRKVNLHKLRLAKKPNSKRKFKIKGRFSAAQSSGGTKGAWFEKAKSAGGVAGKVGGALHKILCKSKSGQAKGGLQSKRDLGFPLNCMIPAS